MTVDEWEIPARLLRLLAAGKWPRTSSEETSQNRRPLVPLAQYYRLDPRRPCVLRLRYEFVPGPPPTTITQSVGVTECFDEFADMLAL